MYDLILKLKVWFWPPSITFGCIISEFHFLVVQEINSKPCELYKKSIAQLPIIWKHVLVSGIFNRVLVWDNNGIHDNRKGQLCGAGMYISSCYSSQTIDAGFGSLNPPTLWMLMHMQKSLPSSIWKTAQVETDTMDHLFRAVVTNITI